MVGYDYTEFLRDDVNVILEGEVDFKDLFCTLCQEVLGSSHMPPIELHKVSIGEYKGKTLVKTNPILADFLVDSWYWAGEYLPENKPVMDMDTVFNFMGKNVFPNSPNKLPFDIPYTFLDQNKTLLQRIKEHPLYEDLGTEGIIIHKIGRRLDDDAKIFWTAEEVVVKKGRYMNVNKSNILQYRTPKMRVLIKVAHNNFVSFFLKFVNPSTDETELLNLRKKGKALKDLVIQSINKKDPNGLIKFYDFIEKEF
jgi:hypothetical protein